MTVQHVETARLFDGAAQVDPLAKLPVVERAVPGVGAGQGRHQLAARLRACGGENGDLVPHARKFPRQQPDQLLDAPTIVLPNRGVDCCYLGDPHRPPSHAPSRHAVCRVRDAYIFT